MSQAKPQKLYLLCLQGGGDTDIKLVGPKTWEWIFQTPYELNIHEAIPMEVQAEMKELAGDAPDSCFVTSGSWDNDRALAATGKIAGSLKEAITLIASIGATLEDEYHGCIY